MAQDSGTTKDLGTTQDSSAAQAWQLFWQELYSHFFYSRELLKKCYSQCRGAKLLTFHPSKPSSSSLDYLLDCFAQAGWPATKNEELFRVILNWVKNYSKNESFSFKSILLNCTKTAPGSCYKPVFLPHYHPDFPVSLKQQADYPFGIYMVGEASLFTAGYLTGKNLNLVTAKPLVAVVGTRHPTIYGVTATKKIVTELVSLGAVIVSGFMHGIDCVAHSTALKQGGTTVAVLGYGHDHLANLPVASQEATTGTAPNATPTQELAQAILDHGGAIISEYPPATQARTFQFPARNRIIASLSSAVVVPEAAPKSGSHITAAYAWQYHRPVFTAPSPITSPYATGVTTLLKAGAELVISGSEVLNQICSLTKNHQVSSNYDSVTPGAPAMPVAKAVVWPKHSILTSRPEFSSVENQVIQLLSAQSLPFDELFEAVGQTHPQVTVTQLMQSLSQLGVRGVVQEHGEVWIKT